MIKFTDTKVTISKGLKDSVIATLCGVSRQTVFNWRKGKVRPSVKNMKLLRKLAK
jgi:DNA-binding transcriptional regulator YiaG